MNERILKHFALFIKQAFNESNTPLPTMYGGPQGKHPVASRAAAGAVAAPVGYYVSNKIMGRIPTEKFKLLGGKASVPKWIVGTVASGATGGALIGAHATHIQKKMMREQEAARLLAAKRKKQRRKGGQK